MTAQNVNLQFDYSKYGFHTEEHYTFKSGKGLNEQVVRELSGMKNEPEWMLRRRLQALEIFRKKPVPLKGMWANEELAELDYENIHYFVRAGEKPQNDWDAVPIEIKNTFEKLGIPEAERKFLAGVGAQFESEVVYHSLREEWSKLGVIFLDTDSALREYPEIFKKYFGTIVPSADNKYAALNTAVWSGGSFVFVPKGVHVDIPLQAYFRINAENMGQFERTMIIVEEGASMHYIEGCFIAGARVQTSRGEVPIEEIVVGDEVLTHKGRYRKVYNTMRRPYDGKLYNIQYYGDSTQTLRVTAEHPLLVVRRERKNERNRGFEPEWVEASTVNVGDYLAIPIAKPEPATSEAPSVTVPIGRGGRHASVERAVSFPQEPDFYRLLGYYFAEGHVSNEHYLTLSFHTQETEYLADATELLTRYFGKAPIVNAERQNGQSLVLCSTEVARAFAYEFGSTVYEKHIPTWMIHAPLPLLTQLVRGMWCGDGSYDPTKNMFRYNSVSRTLAYAFRDALLRLGIAASINYQERGAPRQPIYAVIISSPFNAQFGDLVGVNAPAGSLSGSPFQIDERYQYVPIRQITAIEAQTTVFNFAVEEDESYVCEGVVSHNCTAPVYTTNSLHSAVVEIIIEKGAKCRYTTIQNWANNIFNLVTKRAVVYEEGSMEWVDGNIGCLAQGSTVTTPAGVKPIEALEPGEQVLSYDDETGQLVFRTVVAKRFSGNQPIQTVSVGERKLRVTANHPFYSYTYNPDAAKKSGRYQLAYVRADQLKEAIIPRTSLDYGTPYTLRKPSLVTEFQSLNQYAADLTMSRTRETRLADLGATTDEIMWLFGYWVGDGNIEVKTGKTEDVIRWAKVGFSTPKADRARDRLMETMTTLLDAAPTERADGVHLNWNSKELAELFMLNGFTGSARTKRVPEWVWSLPETQRLAFIAGYLDADGMVVHSKRCFTLKSANRELLEDIASLLVTLGITSRLYVEFSEPRTVTILGYECTAHSSYQLTFSLDPRLVKCVSPVMRASAESCDLAKPAYHRTVGRSQIELPESVEIVDVDVSMAAAELVPTWDIEVEGTGNFVSQGFIVHNSRLTMKYPSVYLMGRGAKGEVLSVAYAGKGQHQDAGAKMVHIAPDTTSRITNKSVSKDGGKTTYRGLAKVARGATNSKINVNCDALILDEHSRSDTIPFIEVEEEKTTLAHEATVGRIGAEQLFYLKSRGLAEADALSMIVLGFMEPFTRELPMEYAVELNRLIQMEMEGSVG